MHQCCFSVDKSSLLPIAKMWTHYILTHLLSAILKIWFWFTGFFFFELCLKRLSITPKVPSSGVGLLIKTRCRHFESKVPTKLLLDTIAVTRESKASACCLAGRWRVAGLNLDFQQEAGEPSIDGAESTHCCVASFEIPADLWNVASKQKIATFCSCFISAIDGAEFQLQETCEGSLLDRTRVIASAENQGRDACLSFESLLLSDPDNRHKSNV